MKTLALVGASGLVGTTLSTQLKDHYKLIPTYCNNAVPGFTKLDVTKPGEYALFLDSIKPDIVIHAAALTDLEKCEREPLEAHRQNTQPLEALCSWAKQSRAKVVFISTDGVFDGTQGNYTETDEPNPINVYGQTKWDAEKIVLGCPDSLILRIAVPYGTQLSGKKFLPNTIAKLKASEQVTGATDLIRSPTLIDDIGEAVLCLLRKDAVGIYHTTGTTGLSLYDAARTIARVFDYDQSLVKTFLSTDIKINGVPSTVKRPHDCSMNCDKAIAAGVPLQSFENGLKYVKAHTQ